ncbi:MAG: hypothetical protein ACLFVD_02625 [Dehalococcoidia bacterium]
MTYKQALKYLVRLRRQLQTAPNRTATEALTTRFATVINKAIQATEDCIDMGLAGQDR